MEGFPAFRASYLRGQASYCHVKNTAQGKGFGSALYFYTARRLGQDGKTLRGSGLQSDEAQKVWGRFKKRVPNNISIVKIEQSSDEDEVTTYPTLDFRN